MTLAQYLSALAEKYGAPYARTVAAHLRAVQARSRVSPEVRRAAAAARDLVAAGSPRGRLPTFTDLGTVATRAADVSSLDKQIMERIPFAGELFKDLGFMTGNLSGRTTPQQLAYINAGKSPIERVNRAVDVQGAMGTKQLYRNGEYETVGGTGRGGPGRANFGRTKGARNARTR